MTIEELQALVAELTAEREALRTNNAKLKREKDTFKAKAEGADIDPAEHARLQEQVEEMNTQLNAAKTSGKTALDAANAQLKEKDGALSGLLVDSGISSTLAKAGVEPDYVEALMPFFKSQSTVVKTDKGYVAQIGDKPLETVIGEYLAGEKGKRYLAAPASSGGGATGGGNKASAKQFKDMSATERMALYRTDRAAYDAGEASLAS